MKFLNKIFGKKSKLDPADDPNMIKVFDEYGREMFVAKEDWKNDVLFDSLEKNRNNPDELYNLLVCALEDGFANDIIPFAEHFYKSEPNSSRSTIILGIVYMQNNRLDDAECILTEFLNNHGEDGCVLTNLAKVYSCRGDNSRAEDTLWHALEIDPNQDNALGWYIAIHHEREGEESVIAAYRRVADLPESWRAQLWLAQEELQNKNLSAAKVLYEQAQARVERPVPTDFLMQISGDLGNNGFVTEILSLVGPLFDAAFHGLLVGNNLIKANLELGYLDAAQAIIDLLYAQKRHDWQQALNGWDVELAKARVAQKTVTSSEQASISMMSILGPLWSRDESPFAKLLPNKRDDAKHITVFGSMVLFAKDIEKPTAQFSDGPGRLSRAIPLYFAEKIHLSTDATGIALIPWAQNQGFALLGRTYSDQDICNIVKKSEKVPELVVAVTIDATSSTWKLLLRLIRTTDVVCIDEIQVKASSYNPGPAVEMLAMKTEKLLAKHASVRISPAPNWYKPPAKQDFADYILRLEQQLAIACMHLDFLKGGGLSGEHDILDGSLHLCLRHPTNKITRIVLAQTLSQMKKVRPNILFEYKDKLDLLKEQYPLNGDVGQLIDRTIARVVE